MVKKDVRSSYFDIRSLIEKGKADVRTYTIKFPNGETFPVLIRPLSDLEMEESQSIIFNVIKDNNTRDFVFNTASEELMNLDEENAEEMTASLMNNADKMNNVDFVQLFDAINQMTLKICYMSMRDFTDEFKMEDLKKLPGIKQMGQEIQRISGYSKQTKSDIEGFR